MLSNTQKTIKKSSRILTLLLTGCSLLLAILMAIHFFNIIQILIHGDAAKVFTGIQTYAPFLQFSTEPRGVMMAQTVSSILTEGLILVILLIVRKVFSDTFMTNTPFISKQVNRLYLISILMLAYTILLPSLQMLFMMIFAPGQPASGNYQPLGLLFPILFYSLAQIFDYGRMLQQESDETL